MSIRLAMVVAVGASAGGCARSVWAPRRLTAKAHPAPAAVQSLLRGIADDISAVSHKYPELSRWHLRQAHGMGFRYEFRCKTVRHRTCMPLRRFGRHGCHLSAWVTRSLLDRNKMLTRVTTPGEQESKTWIFEPVLDLDLTVQARIETGSRTSDGFMAEMTRIIGKHVSALQEERAGPSAPPAPEAQ